MFGVFSCLTLFFLGIAGQGTSISSRERYGGSAEHQLTNYLLSRYPPRGSFVRPRVNASESVEVEVTLYINRIIAVDAKLQSVEFLSIMLMQWTDEFLIWDPNEFDGIDNVFLPLDAIWKPDVTVYDELTPDCVQDSSTYLSHTGAVFFAPSCVIRIFCNVDISRFPFDQHVCAFTVGSWALDNTRVQLTSNSEFIKNLEPVKSPEWILIGMTSDVGVHSYWNDSYAVLECSLTLRRSAPIFAYLLLLPAVLLSVVTSVVFLLPSNSGTVDIGLGILVSFMILLNILLEQTPNSSPTLPLIGYYLTFVSMLIALAIFCATILQMLSEHSKRSTKAPIWVKNIFRCIGTSICIRYQPSEKDVVKKMKDHDNVKKAAWGVGVDDGETNPQDNDWLFIAQVLHRFFFLLYIVINVVASAAILSQLTL